MKKQKLNRDYTRRQFIKTSAAGAGLVVVPGFLASCGGTPVTPATTPPPAPEPGAAVKPKPGYFANFGIDDSVIKNVLAESMSKGGDYADLFFQHKVENYVGLQDGEVNRAYSMVELGCGVRVLKGDQTGFAFTEDLSVDALKAAARTAAAVADGPSAPVLESIERVGTPSYYAINVPWEEVGIEKKIPLLEHANKVAMGHDKRIVKVQVFLSDLSSQMLLATSEGMVVEDSQPMTTAYVTCVAEGENKRREENYHSFGQRRGFEVYSKDMIGDLAKTAAKRTVVLFDAKMPPAGEYPVVLAPGLSGILLHEAIGHGMEADFNRKGISVYSDRIGKPIAPKFVTIVDDGTNPFERGTINIDDEGRESERTVLVENGILKSYMHDKISSSHYNVNTTSNGRRDCYRFPPVPRMRNTYMLNGPHKPEEILKSVKKGIYAETFTNGQVNIGAGDFSFYLKNGYLIEDGKITGPVKDANLIGFGPKVLESVEMVGDDLALFSGAGMCGKDGQRVPVGFGLPTTKCGGISVGGAS